MLLGQSPFSGCDEDELFWSICNEKPVLPRFLSAEASAVLTLVTLLLPKIVTCTKFCFISFWKKMQIKDWETDFVLKVISRTNHFSNQYSGID